MKNNTMLYAAFPGTGKSYFCKRINYYNCSDSDSSKFDKLNFPTNYIEHIKQKIIDKYTYVFISSYKVVREALVKNNLEFTLIYPDKKLKQEYIERFKNSGNDIQFINLIEKNWDTWIDECINQAHCKHIVLKSGQYISDII